MKNFCIITNKSKDPDYKVTEYVRALIEKQGGNCTVLGDPFKEVMKDSSTVWKNNGFDNSIIPMDCECVLALGGDGTIIETARGIGKRQIPIAGINLGTLGFLSVVEKNGIDPAISDLINDNFSIENRMLLGVTTVSDGNCSSCVALNDVTITRNGLSRLICTEVYINDELVSTYSGDGCLVATPTGSTGYNLSAGGPVVTPVAELMCITPICPHSLNCRTIVVSADDSVRIVIGESRKSQDIEAYATIDGQMAIRLKPGDYIRVDRADMVTKLIRFPEQSYFKILHSKLER